MTIEQELRDHHSQSVEEADNPPACYLGNNWWQITREESKVFDLREDEILPILIAWQMYTAIIGTDHNDFHGTDLCNRALPALPFLKEGYQDVDPWTKFAALFSIGARKAYAWFWKDFFWHSRADVRDWTDERGTVN